MMKQRAERYYLEDDYNCAESILRAANDEYGFGLDEKSMRVMAGYGSGLGCGATCGALCGAIAAISAAMIDTRAHATPGFRKICADFDARFHECFGSIDCRDIRKKSERAGLQCVDTVGVTADLLEAYLNTLLAEKNAS